MKRSVRISGDRLVKSPIPCFTTALATIALPPVASLGAAPTNGDTHSPGQALRAQSVDLGVIESPRPATIQQPQTGAGAVGGAAPGGIAGSTRVTH